eukprot:sb/3465980/
MSQYCPTSDEQHLNTTNTPSAAPDPYTLYSTLSSVEFLIGTPLNLLCFLYFLHQPGSVSRLVHLWITLHDVIKSVLAVVPAISSYLHGAPGVLAVPALCTGYGMFWNVAVRQSVFLIALLNATRTISMLKPLLQIKRGLIMGILVGYISMQVLQATVPFWFGVSYTYSRDMLGCGWAVTQLFQGSTLSQGWFLTAYILLNVIHYIGPAVIVIFCNCVSCVLLARTTVPTAASGVKRDATITMVALTVAYAILNLPQCALVLIHLFMIAKCTYLPLTNVIHVLTFTHTANLNSIANAVIYFVRVQKIRQFVCRLGRGGGDAGRGAVVRQSTAQEYTLLSRLSREQFSNRHIRVQSPRGCSST